MKTVLTLVGLLAVAHYAAAQSCNIGPYTEELVPACDPNDVLVRWPNYGDFETFYTCNGVNNPVLQNCKPGLYFCFVLQLCVPCSEIIKPQPCAGLQTQNPPKCVPIGTGTITPGPGTPGTGNATYPTPEYPPDTTTTTTKAPVTAKPTPAPVPTPPSEVTMPTPPVIGSSTAPPTGVSPPPTATESNPNVPMPPTPEPTPPSVDVTPPNVPSP